VKAFRIRFTFDRTGITAFAGGSPANVTDEKLNSTPENPNDTRVNAFHAGVTAFPGAARRMWRPQDRRSELVLPT
jgi:hypothetical protein